MENKNEFDQYAEKYNTILSDQLNFFEQDNSYFAEYKILQLKELLVQDPRRILDFGCGIGRSVAFLKQYFPKAHVVGGDVSPASLALAKKTYPDVSYLLLEGEWSEQNKFDLIFVSNVFHHIPPAERVQTIHTLANACEQGGRLVVFEHNPFNPVTRYLVNTCPFDHDAVLLKPNELKHLFRQAGFKQIKSQYTLFFPQS